MNHVVAKCESHKLCSRACPDFILQEIWTRTQFCQAAKSNTGANSSKRRSEWPQNHVIWEKIWKRCWRPDFFHLVQLRKPWIFCGLHCPNSKASPKNGPTNACFYPGKNETTEQIKHQDFNSVHLETPTLVFCSLAAGIFLAEGLKDQLAHVTWEMRGCLLDNLKLTCFLRRKIIQIKAELSIANRIYSWR